MVIRRSLKLETNEGSLIAIIVNEGSDWISKKLDSFQNILKTFMPDRFKDTDSSRPGYTFDSLRFDLYNRFAEKVTVLSLFTTIKELTFHLNLYPGT